MYCPGWMYDIAAARVASEFLSGDLPLESFASKYSEGLSATYADVPLESLVGAAEGMLSFLSDIEAGEAATEMLRQYTHFRLYFEKVGVPRRMKAMFGSLEGPVKKKEYTEDAAIKSFRTTVFLLRSNPENLAPAGWQLDDDENLLAFGDLVRKPTSLLDAF